MEVESSFTFSGAESPTTTLGTCEKDETMNRPSRQLPKQAHRLCGKCKSYWKSGSVSSDFEDRDKPSSPSNTIFSVSALILN